MKKTLVALAALAATGAFAQATVYGRVDVGYGATTKSGNTSSTAMQSAYDSPTVFGFRVAEDLGGGMMAKANFETGSFSSVNGGATGLNMTRASWAGLSGGFGSVQIGRQTSVATVGNAAYDLGGILSSSAYVAAGISPTVFYGSSKRSGLATYTTPAMGAFSATVGYSTGQDATNNYAVAAAAANAQSSLAASYNAGPLSIGLAAETARSNLAGNRTAASLAGSYNLGVAKVALNFVQSEWDTAANAAAGAAAVGGSATSYGAGWGVGVEVPFGISAVGLQYAKNNENRADGSSLSAVELYAKYRLSKMSNVYFEYGQASSDNKGANGSWGLGLMVNF